MVVNCTFEKIGDGLYRCSREGCKKIVRSPLVEPPAIISVCRTNEPERGPGLQFALLAALLGLRQARDCRCRSLQREMNRLGPVGCRERRADLIARLQANFAEHYNWRDMMAALVRAKKGEAILLAWKLQTLRPNEAIEKLFDLAVSQSSAASALPA